MRNRVVMNRAFLKGVPAGSPFIPLLPFLILSAFSNPAFDDYCHAAGVLKFGFFRAQSYAFNGWSGRYLANLLLGLTPYTFDDLIGNFTVYKAVAVAIIILTFASVFAFVAVLLNSGASLGEKLVAAGLITALFSNNMPDVTEGYYWMPGSVSYQLPNILTLFLFAAAIKAPECSRVIKGILLTLSAILTVAIVGSSETSMCFLLFAVGLVTWKVLRAGGRNRRQWLMLFGLAVVCACVVISAPGNAIRSSHFPDKHRLFFSLGMSLLQAGRFIGGWVLNPAFGLSTIIFITIAWKLAPGNSLLKNRLHLHPFSSLAVLLVFVLLGLFPPYWATGSLGQYRSVNTAYFFFLIGWVINVAVWVSYFREKRVGWGLDLPGYFYPVVLLLVSAALSLTNNTRSAFTDLIHYRAYRFDRAVRLRHSQLEGCARSRVADCQIQGITELPDTVSNPYLATEIGCAKEYWEVRTAREQSQH
jgi:hypothetical protein